MIKNKIDTTYKLQYWALDTAGVFVGWCMIIFFTGIILYNWPITEASLCGLFATIPFILLGVWLAFGPKAFTTTLDKTNQQVTVKVANLFSRVENKYSFSDIESIRIIRKSTKTGSKGVSRKSKDFTIVAKVKGVGKVTLLETEMDIGMSARLWGKPLDVQDVGKRIAGFIGVPF